MKSIPINTVSFTGNEKKYITECIDSGWVSGEGPFIEKFEHQFAHFTNRNFGIAVANGSAALDIAVQALGIGLGDEVIMPTFTIISPALSLIRVGAVPVLVDADPFTWNMHVEEIESKITNQTKAIIVVHIYGLPVDMNPVLALAKKYNLTIIEDAAEMHGQTYFGKKCGSFGTISIFSFYANKIITTGEGGMIVCDDKELADKCRKLKNLAFEKDGPRFQHYDLGYNYRMTNIQAALGLAQLEKISSFISQKREMGSFYNEQLSFLKQYGYQLPISSTDYAENIYWVYGLVAPTQEEATKLIAHLQENKIGIRNFFWCMHEQPVFTARNLFLNERYPAGEELARKGFYIPSGLGSTVDDFTRVVDVFKTFFT